jgi:hypothetical protein
MNNVYQKRYSELSVRESGRVHVVNRAGTPVFELPISLNGRLVGNQACFLDTGSPFSIFNPDVGEAPEKDKIFGLFMREPYMKGSGCVLQGVGGAKVEAKVAFEVGFDLGGVEVKTKVLFLQKHEPTLPKLLLGLECLTEDFGGMYLEKGEKLGSLKCSFAKGGVKVFDGLGAPEWAGEENGVRLLEETWRKVDQRRMRRHPDEKKYLVFVSIRRANRCVTVGMSCVMKRCWKQM